MSTKQFGKYAFTAKGNTILGLSNTNNVKIHKNSRICFVMDTAIANPPLTGMTYRLVNITNALKKKGYEVSWIICNRNFKSAESFELFKSIPAKIHIVSKRLFYNKNYLLSIITENKIEVVIFEVTQTAIFFSHFLKEKVPEIPLILECHDIEASLMEYRKSSEERSLQMFLQYHAGMILDGIVCMTQNDHKTLLSLGIPPDKLFLSQNGIFPEKYIIKKTEKCNEILFIGNMFYKPNQEAVSFFIKEVLPKVSKDFKFKIIGMHPDLLIKKYKNNNRVHFTGAITDWEDYILEINKSCIAVCPVFSGSGMKTKILEYCASKLPIISTNHGLSGFEDCKSIIIANKPSEMARKINFLIKNKKISTQLGTQNCKYVGTTLSWYMTVVGLVSCIAMARKNLRIPVKKYDYTPTWLKENRHSKKTLAGHFIINK
jgi:glycosyltransferase involved in cell wall biosynthesis